MRMPRGITEHQAVLQCLDAESEGFADYKYDVLLKSKYTFQSGRHEGCVSGRFNSVSEFKAAKPTYNT